MRDNKIKKGERRSPATEFKKGHIPWNTGRRGVHYSPATEFKKGHLSANAKYDGYITIRTNRIRGNRYKWIRISQNKWMEYHRYMWIQKHGEIPPCHLIRFKNGNSLDVRIENLECITRAENARRNSNYDSYHYIAHTISRDPELKEIIKLNPEIIELKRLQLKLRRESNAAKTI